MPPKKKANTGATSEVRRSTRSATAGASAKPQQAEPSTSKSTAKKPAGPATKGKGKGVKRKMEESSEDGEEEVEEVAPPPPKKKAAPPKKAPVKKKAVETVVIEDSSDSSSEEDLAPTKGKGKAKAAPVKKVVEDKKASTSGSKSTNTTTKKPPAPGPAPKPKSKAKIIPDSSESSEQEPSSSSEDEPAPAPAPKSKPKAAAPKPKAKVVAAPSSDSETSPDWSESEEEPAPAPPTKSKSKSKPKAKPAAVPLKKPVPRSPVRSTGTVKAPAKQKKADPPAPTPAKVKKSNGIKPVEKVQQPAFDAKRLRSWFEEYEDPDTPGTIGPEGYEKLCTSSGLAMDGIGPLALAYVVSSSQMAHITLSEFQHSFTALRIDTPSKLSSFLSRLVDFTLSRLDGVMRFVVAPENTAVEESKKSLVVLPTSDEKADLSFRSFYRFLFPIGKEDPCQKCLSWDVASAVWGIVWRSLEPGLREEAIGGDFGDFLESAGRERLGRRGVTKDVWEQTLEFIETCTVDDEGNLSNYSEDDSWPTLIDEYAKWVRDDRPKAKDAFMQA